MTLHRRDLIGAGLAAPLLLARPAAAQANWPNGPVRLSVGFPPGGSTDIVARLVQQPLSAILGAPVVVENRPGASGNIAAHAVARDRPDGQSWLVVFDTHAVNPVLIPTPGFDSKRDLAPILLLGTAPMVLTASRGRPWTTLEQVVAAARARPDTITYGTIGNGSLAHLTMELAQQEGGFKLTHVPYRGGGPLQVAAAAGEVDLPIATQAALGGQITAGAVRMLAQTGATRSPRLPDLPTFQQGGIPGIDARAFWGFLGQAALPEAIQMRMEAALKQAFEQPAVQARLADLAMDVSLQGPAGFKAFLDAQMDLWGRVVRERNIRPD